MAEQSYHAADFVGQLLSTQHVDPCKEAIERYGQRVVCLNSATAAEELNLRILVVGPGDEVIVPTYTYTASASAAIHCGATVKFVDIQKDGDPVTHCPEMDYEKLEQAITENTKAIVVVDLGGVVADYERVFEIVEMKRALFTPLDDHSTPLADLSSRILRMPYVWPGATYMRCRRDGRVASTAVVTAIGCDESGWRHVLGLGVVDTESHDSWLRHLCDWAVFEDFLSDSEFREMFEEKLRAVGLWRFAQVLTRASIKFLGASEREWADCDEALVDALMEDILAGGNFGKKDEERSNQAYIISSRGKNGVGNTGILRQLFVSLNDVVYTRWPFSKRWKVALPAGWIYFGARQAFKIARGERKRIHLGKMVDGAIARRELYRQFGIFERE